MSKRPSVQRHQYAPSVQRVQLPSVKPPRGVLKEKADPGFPGGPPFDFNKLVPRKSGPKPTSGTLAVDKIIPKGKKHYLSTLEYPRRENDRIPPDEFALIVELYNAKFGTDYPPNPMAAAWFSPKRRSTREAISHVATNRWNGWMCRQGKGHCPHRGFFSGLGHFISNAAKVVTKIPVIGNIAKLAATPFQLMGAIASGQRLDKAVLGTLKNQVNAVRDLAPYAQMVVSLVPGVGTGIGAALGAAVALSKGRPITEAVMAGIKGSLPGGPIAASGFDAALAIAHGKPVLESALKAAREQLPPAAQKAFDIGLSVAQGRKLQNVIKDAVVSLAPAQVKDMVATGSKVLHTAPDLLNAAKHITNAKALDGFKFASGLLSQAGINEEHLTALRKKLSPVALQGFDAALDLQKDKIPWLDRVKAPLVAVIPEALASEDDAPPEGAVPIAVAGGRTYYVEEGESISGVYF